MTPIITAPANFYASDKPANYFLIISLLKHFIVRVNTLCIQSIDRPIGWGRHVRHVLSFLPTWKIISFWQVKIQNISQAQNETTGAVVIGVNTVRIAALSLRQSWHRRSCWPTFLLIYVPVRRATVKIYSDNLRLDNLSNSLFCPIDNVHVL